MSSFKNLVGLKFGRLTVIENLGRTRNKNSGLYWKCKCDCGNVVEVCGGSLHSGRTISCGCKHMENCKNGLNGSKHKAVGTRQYLIWRKMKERCLNQNCKEFKRYGGRGIKVCDKWLEFSGFWEDMQNDYDDSLTIDRINNNGNYEKSNCRWATHKEQNNNKSSNRIVTYEGETKPITYFIQKYKIRPSQVFNRLEMGWTLDDAIKKPPRKIKRA